MANTSNLIHACHPHFPVQKTVFIVVMSYHASCHVLGNALGRLLLHLLVILDVKEGVHFRSQTHEFLNGNARCLIFHFPKDFLVGGTLEGVAWWVV